MALKLKKPQGTATVSQAMVDNKAKVTIAEETKQEKIDPPKENDDAEQLQQDVGMQVAELEPWCEVQVDASYTKNLGNYQSAKIGVSLKMPCRVAELDDTFVYSRDWVNTKLEGMINSLEDGEG